MLSAPPSCLQAIRALLRVSDLTAGKQIDAEAVEGLVAAVERWRGKERGRGGERGEQVEEGRREGEDQSPDAAAVQGSEGRGVAGCDGRGEGDKGGKILEGRSVREGEGIEAQEGEEELFGSNDSTGFDQLLTAMRPLLSDTEEGERGGGAQALTGSNQAGADVAPEASQEREGRRLEEELRKFLGKVGASSAPSFLVFTLFAVRGSRQCVVF